MKDIHAYEGGTFSHKADRRCPCGPTLLRDLNEPTRLIWRHRTPPVPTARVVLSPGRAMTRWAGIGPEKRSKP